MLHRQLIPAFLWLKQWNANSQNQNEIRDRLKGYLHKATGWRVAQDIALCRTKLDTESVCRLSRDTK
jgi:hypothetical protein